LQCRFQSWKFWWLWRNLKFADEDAGLLPPRKKAKTLDTLVGPPERAQHVIEELAQAVVTGNIVQLLHETTLHSGA
jgi:hypothetical protein